MLFLTAPRRGATGGALRLPLLCDARTLVGRCGARPAVGLRVAIGSGRVGHAALRLGCCQRALRQAARRGARALGQALLRAPHARHTVSDMSTCTCLRLAPRGGSALRAPCQQ
eukprot:153057-Prymnesium_polylepis.1